MNGFKKLAAVGALTSIVSALTLPAYADIAPTPTPEPPPTATAAAAPTQRTWLAQPPPSRAEATSPSGSKASGWRTFAVIGFVGALGALAFYMKRKRTMEVGRGGARLEVLDSARVGAKGQLVLARVGKRTILLGVTEQSVRRIAWLRADEVSLGESAAPAASEAPEVKAPSRPPFTEILKNIVAAATAKPAAATDAAAPPRLVDRGDTSPASILARETRDIVETRRPIERAEPQKLRAERPETIDVSERAARLERALRGEVEERGAAVLPIEGQVSGLLARRNKSGRRTG